jgi:hypothetical protein
MTTTKHRDGSRKQKIHELYSKEGMAPAWTLGMKLKLAESTLRTWFSRWRVEDVNAALVKNAKAKAKTKKTKVA